MIPDWLKEGFPNIWLPYSQMKHSPFPLPVIATEGVKIKLANGAELIDGIASWWTACHGYNHPHIIKSIKDQVEIMPHIMMGGLAHEQAYTLASRLVGITPKNLKRVFFSDSGSTAIEVALKIAVQYWRNQGEHKRNRFISFKNGYHGDTMGAMSLTDLDTGWHKSFSNHAPRQYVLDIPLDEYMFAEFEELLNGIKKSVAGIVIEPLVQAAGGMKFHSADILSEIRRLADKHNIIFIADEIATGFGRTGAMFACQESGIMPDIMCLGKAITGGALGLGATLASEKIFQAFYSDDHEKALMHGPTFMGNPIACAAANASLDLFEREPRLSQVEAIEEQLQQELLPFRKLPNIADTRVKGAIGVVELKSSNPELIKNLRLKFIKNGAWIRPFDNVIYLMPAFTIKPEELSKLTSIIGLVMGDS